MIGLLTIYIAFQQWKTNRNKLKLDLYEKRRNVYLKLKEFLFEIRKNANIEPEISHKFKHEIEIDKYLFKENEVKYLNEIHKRAIEMWHFKAKTFDTNGNPINMDNAEQRHRDIESNHVEFLWLVGQIQIIEKKFSKYFYIK